MKTKTRLLAGAVLCMVVLAAILQDPLRWTARRIHRQIFPEQIPERPVYEGTATVPVDLAAFVGKARQAWPQASAGVVHAAALDVAEGLLQHADIEIGSMEAGRFVPWSMRPWTAAGEIRGHLQACPGFFSEPGRYVFRRKTS